MVDQPEQAPQAEAGQPNPVNPASHDQSPKDIHMKEFSLGADPDTGARWVKWRKELVTRLRYFHVNQEQYKCDALYVYGG